ncbi:MAG: lipocalin-like domain-containing protein [Boseongicola sp.]
MNVNAITLAFLLLLSAASASPQGFAGLGESANGYAVPDPNARLSFPEDHGPHTDFRIEWWYLTANLLGTDGKDYGVQWTLFRNALTPSGLPDDQVWMAHAAIATPAGHYYAQRLARGGLGTAGVTDAHFEAFLDEWYMRGPNLNNLSLFAQGADFAYDLVLAADAESIAQGANGYSVKSDAGLASHYYSQPHYQVKGALVLPEGTVEVTGQGWLDREWSSQPLTSTQSGWDWVALHFDSGDKLMGYRLRDENEGNHTVGTWIPAKGRSTQLRPGDLTMSPISTTAVDGRNIPTNWQISFPVESLEIEVTALYPDSWMPTFVPYWEGPVSISGSHTGRGYLEMTGYE